MTLNTDWTRVFSTSLNYQNSFYDYQNSGATTADVLAMRQLGRAFESD